MFKVFPLQENRKHGSGRTDGRDATLNEACRKGRIVQQAGFREITYPVDMDVK